MPKPVQIVSLLLLVAATAAQAQPRPAGPTAQPLSRASFIATMNGEFGKLDTNHGAKVSAVEYRILTLAGFDRLDLGVQTVAE